MKAAGLALFATGAAGKSALYWTAHPGFVLDVNGFQSNYPKPLMLWERDSSAPNDNEFFIRNSDGTISWASDKNKGLCLEAASSDNGADVQVNYCGTNPLQKWRIETSPPEAGFRIMSTTAKKCLNIAGNTAKNSQRLQLWDCNDDKQQSFTANQDPAGWPSDDGPSQCGACQKSENHCYTKFNFKDGECKCVNNDGKCGNSWYQWICGSGESVAFIDSGCAQCHGLKNAPCPRSDSLAASASDKSALYWTAHPGFVLDISGFQGSYPKPVMLWERDSSQPNDNEFFSRTPVGPNAEDGKILWASEKNTGFCLEAASSENGADVQINYCSSNPLQKWNIGSDQTGAATNGFRIVSRDAKKCINVDMNTAKNQQRLQLWDCNDDAQQSFTANQNPASWISDGPSPKPAPPAQCGACAKSSNHCYTKFNFADGECKCANNDGKCGNSWYQWICGSGAKVAFIDSGCAKCIGLNNAPCPRSGVTVV